MNVLMVVFVHIATLLPSHFSALFYYTYRFFDGGASGCECCAFLRMFILSFVRIRYKSIHIPVLICFCLFVRFALFYTLLCVCVRVDACKLNVRTVYFICVGKMMVMAHIVGNIFFASGKKQTNTSSTLLFLDIQKSQVVYVRVHTMIICRAFFPGTFFICAIGFSRKCHV